MAPAEIVFCDKILAIKPAKAPSTSAMAMLMRVICCALCAACVYVIVVKAVIFAKSAKVSLADELAAGFNLETKGGKKKRSSLERAGKKTELPRSTQTGPRPVKSRGKSRSHNKAVVSPATAASSGESSSDTDDEDGNAAEISSGRPLDSHEKQHFSKTCETCRVTSSDPMMICSGCNSYFYCNKKCHGMHWKNGHKQECLAIRKHIESEFTLQEGASTGVVAEVFSAEDDVGIQAAVMESQLHEESCTAEDVGAEAYVKKYCDSLLEADPSFNGIFNPPGDGDCLVRCAVEHDFWSSSHSCNQDSVLTAHVRFETVDRVEETLTNYLEAQALEVEAAMAHEFDEVRREDLAFHLQHIRGPAMEEVRGRCEIMARPGVVMGKDELQALADVRGACVEVSFTHLLFKNKYAGLKVTSAAHSFPHVVLSRCTRCGASSACEKAAIVAPYLIPRCTPRRESLARGRAWAAATGLFCCKRCGPSACRTSSCSSSRGEMPARLQSEVVSVGGTRNRSDLIKKRNPEV